MEIGFIQQTVYGALSDSIKATKRFPPDNLAVGIIAQSKHFTRKDVKR